MRWEDQSEALTLPQAAVFLESLNQADAQRLLAVENDESRVIVSAGCQREMRAHLETSQDELGGLLIGRAYQSPAGVQMIVVESCIASRVFDSTGVSLRMETEIWDRARPMLDAGALVVGWYHSHPNLGAFFSETDRTTQRSFFHHPFSVGIVIDPVRDEMRAFVGPDSLRVPDGNLIVVACG